MQQNTNPQLTSVAEILAQGMVRLHRRKALEAKQTRETRRTGMSIPPGTRPQQRGAIR